MKRGPDSLFFFCVFLGLVMATGLFGVLCGMLLWGAR